MPPRKTQKPTLAGTTNFIQDAAAKVAPAPKAKSIYNTAARPVSKNAIAAIVQDGKDPETVLAKVRGADGVVNVSVKTSDAPIEYLFRRVPEAQRIPEVQYRAAQTYLADNMWLQRTGSNTQAIINAVQYAVQWTASDIDKKIAGELMKLGAEPRMTRVDDVERIHAALRIRTTKERLMVWETQILNDLLLREYPVGIIAQRWGIKPEQARIMVDLSLADLVRVFSETHAEFQAWLTVYNSMQETCE